MNRSKARKWVRKAIVAMQRFWDSTTAAELEILGGMVDWPTERTVEKVKEASQPEKIAAFKAAQTNAPPPRLEEILTGAACGATDDEINDDAWIDGVIDEIRENFRGVAIRDEEDDIVIFVP